MTEAIISPFLKNITFIDIENDFLNKTVILISAINVDELKIKKEI